MLRPSELARWRAEREVEPDEDLAPRPVPGKTTRVAVELAELWDEYVAVPVARAAGSSPAHAAGAWSAHAAGTWSARPAQAYGGIGTGMRAFALPRASERLPDDARRMLERALGADFASVRVHVGPEPAAHGARALARGEELFFAPGEYDPSSPAGLRVLAHELTHVVQQRAGRVPLDGSHGGLHVDAGLEAEADAAAAKLEAPRAISAISTPGSAGALGEAAGRAAAGAPAPAAPAERQLGDAGRDQAPVQPLRIFGRDVEIRRGKRVVRIGHSFAAMRAREAALRGAYQIKPRKGGGRPRAEGPNNVVPELRIVVCNGANVYRQVAARFYDQGTGSYVVFRSRFDLGLVEPRRAAAAAAPAAAAAAAGADASPAAAAGAGADASPAAAAGAGADAKPAYGVPGAGDKSMPRTSHVAVPPYREGAANKEAFVPAGAASFFHAGDESDPVKVQALYRAYQRTHEGSYREGLGVRGANAMAFHHSEQSFFKMLNAQPEVARRALQQAEIQDPAFFEQAPLTVVAVSVDLFTTRAACDNCQRASEAQFNEGMFFDAAMQIVRDKNIRELNEQRGTSLLDWKRRPQASYAVADDLHRFIRIDADFFHIDDDTVDGEAAKPAAAAAAADAKPAAAAAAAAAAAPIDQIRHALPGEYEDRASVANRSGNADGDVVFVNVPVNLNWDVARSEAAMPDEDALQARALMRLAPGEAGCFAQFFANLESPSLTDRLDRASVFAFHLWKLKDGEPARVIPALIAKLLPLGILRDDAVCSLLRQHRTFGFSVDDVLNAELAGSSDKAARRKRVDELVAQVGKAWFERALREVRGDARTALHDRRPGKAISAAEFVEAARSVEIDPEVVAALKEFGVDERGLPEVVANVGMQVVRELQGVVARQWNRRFDKIRIEICNYAADHILQTWTAAQLTDRPRLQATVHAVIVENLAAHPFATRFGVSMPLSPHVLQLWAEQTSAALSDYARSHPAYVGLRKEFASRINPEYVRVDAAPSGAKAAPAGGARPAAPAAAPPDPSIRHAPSLQQASAECGFYAAYSALMMYHHAATDKIGGLLNDPRGFNATVRASGQGPIRDWIGDEVVQRMLADAPVLLISSLAEFAALVGTLRVMGSAEARARELNGLGAGYQAAWLFYTQQIPRFTVVINSQADNAALHQPVRGYHYIAAHLVRDAAGVAVHYTDSLPSAPGAYDALLQQLRTALEPPRAVAAGAAAAAAGAGAGAAAPAGDKRKSTVPPAAPPAAGSAAAAAAAGAGAAASELPEKKARH